MCKLRFGPSVRRNSCRLGAAQFLRLTRSLYQHGRRRQPRRRRPFCSGSNLIIITDGRTSKSVSFRVFVLDFEPSQWHAKLASSLSPPSLRSAASASSNSLALGLPIDRLLRTTRLVVVSLRRLHSCALSQSPKRQRSCQIEMQSRHRDKPACSLLLGHLAVGRLCRSQEGRICPASSPRSIGRLHDAIERPIRLI